MIAGSNLASTHFFASVLNFLSECRLHVPGGHSHTKVVRVLIIKNVEKGSIFGLVASSTFLEKRVLFRLSFDV